MNELLPGFEPSEEDLYQVAINQTLEHKEECAVGLLKMQGEYKKSHVCFSGGKDSIVIKHLAQRAGIVFDSVYSVTTIDPPELVKYIKKHHSDVIWKRQKLANLDKPALMRSAALRGRVIADKEKRIKELEQQNRKLMAVLKEAYKPFDDLMETVNSVLEEDVGAQQEVNRAIDALANMAKFIITEGK